ncbi:DUF2088 domain-containing protein, partial [bacterium]|nr:DUF2088 domain-containing protein [bacterium]
MAGLLERARAALPGARWEAASPARVAAAEAPSSAGAKIARRLAIELEGARRTVVVLNDESRATSPEMVAVVVRAAVAASRSVKVLFASGSHPLPTDASLRAHMDGAFARLGREDLQGLPVLHHVAKDEASLAELGGFLLHRDVVEADKVLALGSVEPHYFAGWTGAHKTATVGVMGFRSIEENHALALEPGSRVLALEGNPVFDGVARAANALGSRLVCVNEVRVLDRPVAWSAGPWRAALEGVLEAARTVYVRTVDAPVDLLVASVEGPLGRNLYQAEKGIKNSEACVAEGGAVVLCAPCEDGTGPARFLDLLARARDHASALERVREDGYRLGDHKAVKVRALE